MAGGVGFNEDALRAACEAGGEMGRRSRLRDSLCLKDARRFRVRWRSASGVDAAWSNGRASSQCETPPTDKLKSISVAAMQRAHSPKGRVRISMAIIRVVTMRVVAHDCGHVVAGETCYERLCHI